MDTFDDYKPEGFVLGNFSQPKIVRSVITLIKEQYETLSKGKMAVDADDRWIVFVKGAEFYFHRSWGGERIYQVYFSMMDTQGSGVESYSCAAFFVESNPEFYKLPESDEDITKNFQDLISVLVT